MVRLTDGTELPLDEAVAYATHIGERHVGDLLTEADIDRAYIYAKDWVWSNVADPGARDRALEVLRGGWGK